MFSNTRSSASTKVLRVGLVSPVQGRDPRGTIDFVNIIVLWQMFETLYAPAVGDQNPPPLLLKEPLRPETTSGANRIFTGGVVDGLKFWDGTIVTGQNIVDCLRRNRTFAVAADAEARGDRIAITTKRADIRLDRMLTRLDLSVVVERNRDVLGTGAYMPAADSTPGRLHLVRNPHYRKPAAIDEIEFVVYPRDKDGNAEELRRAIREDRVDFTTFLHRDETQDLNAVRKSFELGTSTALLFFNTERAPLNDTRVRKAIARAIDRVAITRMFYTVPLAHVATGLLPPALGRLPDGITYHLDSAKALLAEAGVKAGRKPLTLLVIWGPRPYLPRPSLVAETIVQQLRQLGFTFEVEVAGSVQDYFERTARGDYDMVLAGYIPDTPHAADFLDVILSSERVPDGKKTVLSSANLSRWRNQAMDAELARFRVEASPASRTAISRMLGEEVPLLPLMYGPTVVVHSWRLKNYPSSFFAQPFFSTMDLGD